MAFWKRLLGKKTEDQEPVAEEPTVIATAISPLIDGLAHAVFLDFKQTLLKKPIEYIAPAVWGASKFGSLTSEQKAINKMVLPVIKMVFGHLALEGISEAQRFAVDFLIRGLIINRITYTIEAAKAHGLGKSRPQSDLADLEIMGNA